MRFTATQLAHMGARELGNVIYHTALRRGTVDVERAIYMGMIPEEDLQHRGWYWGYCRHANVAMWEDGRFCFHRVKFGGKVADYASYPSNEPDVIEFFVPILEGEGGHGWEGTSP